MMQHYTNLVKDLEKKASQNPKKEVVTVVDQEMKGKLEQAQGELKVKDG